MEVIPPEEASWFLATHEIESRPGKGVFARKPGFKLKACGVICGNCTDVGSGDDNYAGCGDIATIRVAMKMLADHPNWTAGAQEIRTAFLNALLTNRHGKVIVVTPPRIVIDAQVAREGDLQVVRKALYGLRELPKA